jgi:zinc transport system substrate-binding protein
VRRGREDTTRATGRFVAALAVVTLGVTALAGPAAARDRLPVVVSVYPVAWAVERVGGPRVIVENLTPPGAEPHDLELTTDQRDAVDDAAVAFVLGKDFQPAVEDAADQREGPTVALLDRRAIGRGSGSDPHVWLDPTRMIAVVDAVTRALGDSSPKDRAAFQRRAAATMKELEELDERFRDGLADCARDTIVTSHEAFGWLAKAYGLRQVGVAGIAPDAEPDARRLGELADLVRERGITTVFTEELVSPRIAETLAREAGGVDTAVLNPLESLSPAERKAGDDYVTVMDANLEKLRAALACT